ncbi:MAG: CPBP family intramembrane glutamic endopeptidase [Chitinophagaceae bacterium]
MYNRQNPKIDYGAQLGIFFGLVGGAFILAAIAQAIFMFTVVDMKTFLSTGSADNLKSELFTPKNRNVLLTMQVVSTFFMFFIPALVYAKIVHGKPFEYLGLKMKSNKMQVGLVVLLAFIGLALSGALGELNELIPISKGLEKKFRAMEAEYQSTVLAIATIKNFGDYLVALAVIAILPAFFEELLFRGVMQQLLEQWTNNGWLAVILTGIIFSAIHLSYYGFLPRLGLGIVLGLIFFYTRNMWLNVLLHFLNNAVAVTALYYSNVKGLNPEKVLDEKFPIWIGAIALVIVVYLLQQLYKVSIANGSHYINNTIAPSKNIFEQNNDDRP